MGQTRYQPPSNQQFFAEPEKLEQLYKTEKKISGKSENEQRLDFVHLFSDLNAHVQLFFADAANVADLKSKTSIAITDTQLMTATVLFEMELIRKTYGGGDPVRTVSWGFFNTGSVMYTYLKQFLGINEKNAMTDEDIFVHLFKLHTYVKYYFPEKYYGREWPTKATLLQNIQDMWLQVRQRQKDKIQQLVNALPEMNILHTRIAKLPQDYQKDLDNRWFTWLRSSKRKNQIGFITFVAQACQKVKPPNQADVVNGLIIFNYLEVVSEYSYLSPNGFLYDWLSQINAGKVSAQQSIEYLDDLMKFINKLRTHPDDRNYNRKFLIQYEPFIQRIGDLRCALQDQMKQRSTSARCLASAVNITTQAGLSLALPSFIRAYGFMGLVSIFGESSLLSWLGTASALIPGVGLTATSSIGLFILLRCVIGEYLTEGLNLIYGYALQSTCETLGEKTADIIMSALGRGKTGLTDLLSSNALNAEDKVFLQEWLNTLLESPDVIVAKADKERIKLIFGLDAGSKPEPLPIVRRGSEMDEAPIVRRLG